MRPFRPVKLDVIGRRARSVYRSFATLGIRREDPSRIWERRVPLTPEAVSSLVKDEGSQLAVEVESCGRRCFVDEEYARVSLLKELAELMGQTGRSERSSQPLDQCRPGARDQRATRLRGASLDRVGGEEEDVDGVLTYT